MDWSLLQPHASKPLLRDVRGFKSAWWYYGAMIIDPILRFNWIFYTIYTHDLEHNTICSFLIALSEVTRRGIWTLFRVENEHCSNVARFQASRDVPLPYSVQASSEEDERPENREEDEATGIAASLSRHRSHTATGLEAQAIDSGSLRRRPTPVRTFTEALADAHTQDFEKKRKPGIAESIGGASGRRMGEIIDDVDDVGSSDDEENEDQDLLDAEALIRDTSRDRREPNQRDIGPDRS